MLSMLIAEEFILLTQGDAGVSLVTGRETGVAGALLAELSAMERVMLDDRNRIQVLDPSPTGDEILDSALLRLRNREGKKPDTVLSYVGKDMLRRLQERLSRDEILQESPTRLLGLRLWSAWPFVRTSERDALRQEVAIVLQGAREPDVRIGSLISLLQAVNAWGTALPSSVRGGLTGRDIRTRAKEISKGRWGSEAVARAIESAAAAVVAVTAATGSSS